MKTETDPIVELSCEGEIDCFVELTQRPVTVAEEPVSQPIARAHDDPAHDPTGSPASAVSAGIVVGHLVGIGDGGRTPLVTYPGQCGIAALPARTVVDVHGAHIGRDVVLTFDAGDASKPIILGVIRPEMDAQPALQPGQIEVEADGDRLIVTANEQLVLRCGSASITLTRAGKVLIQGSYVLSRSTGVNRIKGGSVQLN